MQTVFNFNRLSKKQSTKNKSGIPVPVHFVPLIYCHFFIAAAELKLKRQAWDITVTVHAFMGPKDANDIQPYHMRWVWDFTSERLWLCGLPCDFEVSCACFQLQNQLAEQNKIDQNHPRSA